VESKQRQYPEDAAIVKQGGGLGAVVFIGTWGLCFFIYKKFNNRSEV